MRVKFSFIRLWDTPDPVDGDRHGGLLDELQSYWIANEGATPRDVAHLVSGQGRDGRHRVHRVLCDPAYGYGVSQVYGSFDVMDPDDTWDVVVVAHELGHNFGSRAHALLHAAARPLLQRGAGCYNGPSRFRPAAAPS